MTSFGLAIAALGLLATPVGAQVRTVDPNSAIDADLSPQAAPTPARPTRMPPPAEQDTSVDPGSDAIDPPVSSPLPTAPARTTGDVATATTQDAASGTYQRDDVIAAAEGVFGKGAQGLAELVEKLLKEQGRPNAYIAGREASGAFIVGVRYGSGVMTHKVEGPRKVFWTGPSLGFDVGGDATKVFTLVYNLYDSQEIFNRFPAAEGRLYLIGGFAATYLRRGNVVLIPIRLGVGWRAGVNVGYMKFTERSKWLPF